MRSRRTDSVSVRRTRWVPSPRRGEGWGEGVRTHRETVPPHPTPLPMGEGADRVRRAGLAYASRIVALVAALALTSSAASADPIAEFYKGKNINWILSAG